MGKLNENWISEGLIDFEYKKYVLLGYLKKVRSHFHSTKLYPQLAELVVHYNHLIQIRDKKELLRNSFPKRISKLDFEKLKVNYQKIVEDDEVMIEIQTLVSYALPKMKGVLGEGKEISAFVEQHLQLDEVGVRPLYDKEGYIMLRQESSNDLMVYQYYLSMIQDKQGPLSGLKTSFVSQEARSFARTVEQIKLDLVKKFKELPNPATFLVTSQLHFPLRKTFLPVAKRMLIRDLQFNTL